jgi:hypothetical protein
MNASPLGAQTFLRASRNLGDEEPIYSIAVLPMNGADVLYSLVTED